MKKTHIHMQTQTKKAAQPAKTQKLSKAKVKGLLAKNSGRIVSITHKDEQGTEHKFTGHFKPAVSTKKATKSVKKSNAPTNDELASVGMMRVNDMVKKGIRTVDLSRVTQVKAGGVVYSVK